MKDDSVRAPNFVPIPDRQDKARSHDGWCMREFLIIAHEATTDPSFSLADLPGSAGRLDVLCRCVTAGLLRSHGIRDDTIVTVVIRDRLTIQFTGSSIRHLQPDERSTAARFRDAFTAAADAVGHVAVDVAPGITVSRLDLDTTLAECANRGTVILLAEDGDPVWEWTPPDHPIFVLSDHHSFTAEEREQLASVSAETISLGPVALHADQAITIAHHVLDIDGDQMT